MRIFIYCCSQKNIDTCGGNDLIDKNGMFTRAITYSEFKTSLDEGRKKILAEYECSIIDFLSILKRNAYLKKEFANEVIERIQKLQDTSLYINSTLNNSYIIAGKFRDIDFMNQFQSVANNEGFKVHDIVEQVMIQICMGYVSNIEYLKREMLLLIDFEKMNIKNPGKLSFGVILTKLAKDEAIKEEMGKNIFFKYLNADTRNALAHHSYYFENSKIYLCINGLFDPEPSEMGFYELMKESITMNVLSLSFYLIFVSMRIENKYSRSH